MRIYGSVQLSFWENPEIQHLSDQAKLLAIYLITGPHSNMLGCLRLPDGYITEDLKWNNQSVKNAFQKLSDIQFLTRDDNSSWVVIHHFLKWNPVQNPRQGIGIQKLFESVPSHSLVFQRLTKSLLTYGKYLSKEFLERLNSLQPSQETLSEDSVADKEQDQDTDKDKKVYMSDSSDRDDFLLASQHPLADQNSQFRSQAKEILQFLNEKTGRNFQSVDVNLKLIIARLKTGATYWDCRQVIAKKTREWKGDSKMSEYLRPATLFNATKFEQYRGELTTEEFSHDGH